jgi:hypothetical protein
LVGDEALLPCAQYKPFRICIVIQVSQEFLDELETTWEQKLEAAEKRKCSFLDERKALMKVIDQNDFHDIQDELQEKINELKCEIHQGEAEKTKSMESLVNKISSDPEAFSSEFRLTRLHEPNSMLDNFDSFVNVEAKKEYLYKEILKLERVQIAESIMEIELISTAGPQEKYRVRFDEVILNQQLEMTFAELMELNKAREYSLFGIHKTGPNSPYPYFSYFKELNDVCKAKDFIFQHSMSYNKNPHYFDKQLKAVSHSKTAASKPVELSMCHHCKTVLPSTSFYSCSKKCKKMHSEPCNILN